MGVRVLQKATIKQKLTKKDMAIFVLLGITAVLITVAGIYYRQSFLHILPLYISIIISMLQTRVNRFAYLMGGMNSILYGAVYIYYKLYGAAFSALLFSFPIQILTFIRWNKHKRGNSTALRKLSNKQRVCIILGYSASLAVMWFLLPLIGSQYVFLDSATTLLGILIYFLTMFAYIEYTSFMLVNCTITTVLYITMLKAEPETMTYLIYSIYSIVCTAFAFFEARKLYRIQQNENMI